MSDHDQTLSDTSADTPFGNPDGRPLERTPQLEAILTLDEVMSSARRVERTARICLAGDLQAEYAEAYEELATLVDAEGKVVTSGDQALSDVSRAEELAATIRSLREQMLAATRRVRFRAMASEDWEAFDKAHRDSSGDIKDADAYHNELIAKCAIAPTMTVAEVVKLRAKLGPEQVDSLATAAYLACKTGGLDVPKLPSFLPVPKPQASGKN